MALERKDVRAKLDPDVHAALVVIAGAEHLDIAEFVERELIKVVSQKVHDANVISAGTKGLGISGISRSPSGNTKAGA